MHFCNTLKKDIVDGSRVKKDTKNQLFSCRCICGACCSLPAPIAIIDHSPGPASGCVKKPALLSAISQSYLPLTELPLSTLASPAPSSPEDTEKRAQKQLHSGKTAVAAFQEAESWHEDAEEARNKLSNCCYSQPVKEE